MSNTKLSDVVEDKTDGVCEMGNVSDDKLKEEIRRQIAAIEAMYESLRKLESLSDRLSEYLGGRLLETAPINHSPER